LLLALLYLGMKDIRLGPSPPAFLSPGVLDILTNKFDIKSITSADQDLKAILREKNPEKAIGVGI
jgi:hydroxylamine reductase